MSKIGNIHKNEGNSKQEEEKREEKRRLLRLHICREVTRGAARVGKLTDLSIFKQVGQRIILEIEGFSSFAWIDKKNQKELNEGKKIGDRQKKVEKYNAVGPGKV